MKIMQIIIISVAVLAAALLAVYTFFGGFKKLEFVEEKQGGETLVYEELVGDYRQSAAGMDRVYYSLLNDHKLETYKGFGIYYDNPQKVEKSKLRADAGCIVEEADVHRIPELKDPFRVKVLPEKEYLVTGFPFKGKMSVMVGIMKVYPAMSQYIKKKGYSEEGFVMEIYDTPGKKITYRKEIIHK